MKTILADLSRLRYQLRKITQPAVVVDGLELICGGGYSGEKAAQTIQSGWSSDPVHPGRHIYAKMALNLMERLAQAPRMTEAAQQGRKRTWSTASSGNSSGCGGISGRQTPRSASWKDMRDFGRFSSGGGHISGGPRGGGGGGGVGGYQHNSSYTSGSYSGYSGGGGNSYYTDHGKYGYSARDGYQPGGHRGGRGSRGGRR